MASQTKLQHWSRVWDAGTWNQPQPFIRADLQELPRAREDRKNQRTGQPEDRRYRWTGEEEPWRTGVELGPGRNNRSSCRFHVAQVHFLCPPQTTHLPSDLVSMRLTTPPHLRPLGLSDGGPRQADGAVFCPHLPPSLPPLWAPHQSGRFPTSLINQQQRISAPMTRVTEATEGVKEKHPEI